MTNKTVYELLSDIMNPDIESDITHIRETIHLAEDTDFTVEESKIVSPWLLNFAKEYRDSLDTEDEYPVYSAIRTGASMLSTEEVECLFPLLADGHKIETSLVTVKMIGRIFKAQPPSGIGRYELVANEIYNNIIVPMTDKPMAVLSHRDAARVELCLTSMIAMGSALIAISTDSISDVLEKVIDETWFKKYLLHNVQELRATWSKRAEPISPIMKKSLDDIINFLEEITNE